MTDELTDQVEDRVEDQAGGSEELTDQVSPDQEESTDWEKDQVEAPRKTIEDVDADLDPGTFNCDAFEKPPGKMIIFGAITPESGLMESNYQILRLKNVFPSKRTYSYQEVKDFFNAGIEITIKF